MIPIRSVASEVQLAARSAEGASASGASSADDKRAKEAAEAAKGFEAIFVRQLLTAAKIGGANADQGYGSMATEALSSAICDGGGLGLAQKIQDAIAPTFSHQTSK